jgi:hypothetical protein
MRTKQPMQTARNTGMAKKAMMINDRRKFLSLKYIRLLKVSNGRSTFEREDFY